MGFFDKLKAVKNAVTGGAAKVYVECDGFSFSEPFTVTVVAQTKDAPVKISRAYLKVQGEEEVEVPDVDVEFDSDGDVERRLETVRASHVTVDQEYTVIDAQELEANKTYRWEVEVELPADAPLIYRGRFCEHTYCAFAGLDCFGNDPDSGWVALA
ncbi:hypothetical protein [Desulfoluna spongiiphila]|uniref:Uncharacterized protein n=1 Tax=Desulfoluna spongiiphila TaxID=419481 RepID=A0A1G5C0P3_9BACT|nr:hypothetical protein [Desulfoluna spongiiphila]SCX95963.1 hypothetical protein SAMN05216233_102302 [Desulfoluna spongiiphila]